MAHGRVLNWQWGLVGAPILLGSFAFQTPTPKDPDSFTKSVRPVLKQYCISCHSGEKPAAKLDLSNLNTDFKDPRVFAKWSEVVNVLNSKQMPPRGMSQPSIIVSNSMIEAISNELAKAEVEKRGKQVVLRRLNRAEYNNTIRDLCGVDLNHAKAFPEDPPAGGFDNIGQALSLSPLQIELYYAAARDILDHAIVDGPKPATIKWHFEPEENKLGMDQYRVAQGGNRGIILNDGANPTVNGFTVMHHDSWDKHVDFRDFKFPVEGDYVIRFRAFSKIPTQREVVDSAQKLLKARLDRQMKDNPNGKKWHESAFQRDLNHFQTNRMYDYGPARLNVSKTIAGTPMPVRELDIDADESAPKVFELVSHFTDQQAGVNFFYSYSIPKELENFWMQNNESFARPEVWIDWIEVEGPVHPVWPPRSHQMIMIDSPNKRVNESAYARDVIANFMKRAYRRPVNRDEIEQKLKIYTRERTANTFNESIKMALTAILVSPNFLFLAEPDSESVGRPLSDHEIANRLSYFLWSSMPDDQLTQLASTGKLKSQLSAQVDRMLKDPKSESFVKNFAGQWLGLRKVGANPPVENLYPQYDRHLETSMIAESEGFFREILQSDLDVRNLVKSQFVTINERLARYYGIHGVRGDTIRKVLVPKDVKRGGIVTQASILSVTSNGTRTSPVTRGTWILKTLLGNDPGLPVANVGEIASKVPGIDKATVRQRLKIHRENPSCARCHDKIDPLGLALENFNAAGEWRFREGHGYNGRIEENDPVIDASAIMPDGTPIQGVEGLQNQILKQEDSFLNHFATQIATYAIGRELGFADQPKIKKCVSEMKDKKYTIRSLIHSLTTSDLFLKK
jgi:hypothetical protein